jgi:hypothetical protein
MIPTTLTQHVAAERTADLHRSAARSRLTAPDAGVRRPLRSGRLLGALVARRRVVAATRG